MISQQDKRLKLKDRLKNIAKKGEAFLIDMLNADPKPLAILEPNASVQALALNFISFVVGIYKISLVG